MSRITPWSAAKSNTFNSGIVHAVALQQLPASCSFALSLMLEVMTFGTKLIGYRPSPSGCRASAALLFCYLSRCRALAAAIVRLDEEFHDAVFHAIFYGALVRQPNASRLKPRPRAAAGAPTPSGSVPPRAVGTETFRTHTRALFASHTKRHSGKHERRLSGRMRSVGFCVDSGGSWDVHLFAKDLLNTRPRNEVIAGVDGE
eukprot:4001068-Pleurochrysis_carterae.AAC.1